MRDITDHFILDMMDTSYGMLQFVVMLFHSNHRLRTKKLKFLWENFYINFFYIFFNRTLLLNVHAYRFFHSRPLVLFFRAHMLIVKEVCIEQFFLFFFDALLFA